MRLLLKNLKDTTIHWTSLNHFTSLNAKIKFVLYTEPRRNHLHGTSITTIGGNLMPPNTTKYQIFFKKILFLALLDLLCCMWASSSFGEENCLVAVHGLLIAVASLVVGFPGGSDGKESAWNAGDLGSIPGSGRSSREGNGNPLQYSCLENFTEREAWWATVHDVAEMDMIGWPTFHTSLLLLRSTGSGGWAP